MGLNLFRYFTLPYLWREKGCNFLTLAGICLGVAVFISIEIANHSTLNSFRESLDSIAGKSTIQIDGPEFGINEEIFKEIIQVPGILYAAPVVQGYPMVMNKNGEILLVQGIDLFREEGVRDYSFNSEALRDFKKWEDFFAPFAIVLSNPFAERYQLKVGDSLPLSYNQIEIEANIVALLKEEGQSLALGGNFAVMDIASAQEAFDKIGRLDRIDIVSSKDLPIDEVIKNIEKILPPGLQVKRPKMRNRQIESILASFQINLKIISYIALLVGMFLIYNTLNMSVERRRQEMAIIRSLGGSRMQVYGMILQQALILGLFGSILGIFVGFLLANSALSLVLRTVNSLYIISAATDLTVTKSIIFQGLIIGLLSTLISSFIPARRASKIKPHLAIGMNMATNGDNKNNHCIKLATIALLCFICAFLLSRFGIIKRSPISGYIAALFVIFGFTFITPGFTKAFLLLSAPIIRRIFSIPGKFAISNLLKSLSRTSVAIAALMASLAMLISIAIMIKSFRETVNMWTDQTLKADLYITSAIRFARGTEDRLRGEILKLVEQIDGVEACDPYRFTYINYQDAKIALASNDFNGFIKYGNIWFKSSNQNKILKECLAKEGVLISENLEIKYGKKPGDFIKLNTPDGIRSFLIHGVYYDYSNDLGVVLMDRVFYKKIYKEDYISTLGIFLMPTANRDKVIEEIKQLIGTKEYIMVMDGRQLKDKAMVTFDESFQIFYALEIIAMFIALLGITNSLMISIMNRRREIATLRSIGALKNQIRKTIVVEASLIGLIGNILGILSGVVISFVMIFVITKHSFGWSIQYRIQFPIIFFSIAPVLITSILAGCLPAHIAASLPISEALRYE